MSAIRLVSDLLAFGLELAAIAALAWWGFVIGNGVVARVLLGLGAPASFVLVWGRWLAPRADLRLELPWLALTKVALFGAAAIAIFCTGHPRIAAAFALAATVSLALATLDGRTHG